MKSQLVSFTWFCIGTPVNLLGSSFSFVPSSHPRSRNELQSAISIAPFEQASKSRSSNRYDGLFMSDSADEPDVTKDDTIIIRSLEASLQANGIQVPDEKTVQNLLDQRQWIYPSERVDNMLMALNEEQLYSIFNYQHHLDSSTQLFNFLAKKRKKVSVVYGHKAQGKSQFLFFVFKLLQAMGEKVLFLDKTIRPLEEDSEVEIDSDKFCGHLWRDSFLQIEGSVKTCLHKFYEDGRPASFGKFIRAIRQYTRSSGTRIWIIVDEVVLFEKFPIRLPEEQDLGPFNWIITGSAGIGSWVGKRHLEKFVFDLPLFTKDESLTFATRFCNTLDINLEDELGVPSAGIDDWLEDRFGGVVGYIAEMLLEISKGNSASQYIFELSGRIKTILRNVSERRKLPEDQLASVWLKEMQSNDNTWDCLRDAGLCGSSPPRGVIFTQILKWLFNFYTQDIEDELKLLRLFRSSLSVVDPGLDGCLLELEEILKLKASYSMTASLFTLMGQEWKDKKSIDLPPNRSPMTVLVYEESPLRLKSTPIQSSTSSWTLIEVPTGFDVIDVVLVNNTSDYLVIYGIQITRSMKPFAKHHTFDTCHPRSIEKLNKLWSVISNYFKVGDTVEKFYVMLAPNCEKDEFRPPATHSNDYYFSPSSILPKDDSSKSKARSSRGTKKGKKTSIS